MAVDIERVQSVLHAAIGPSQKPTQAQVLEISSMTYIEEARKEIQRMIERRLRHTESYGPSETYHTLVLIEKSLSTASKNFVDFCTDKVHLVIFLTHYERTSTPANREMAGLISSSAHALSKALLDHAGLAEKRRIILAETAFTVAPPPTQSRTVPLPTLLTPPVSPEKLRKAPPTARLPKGTVLRTSDSTPPRASGSNDNLKDNVSDLNSSRWKNSDNPPLTASIFLLNKEEVAKMTFKSEELDRILRVLDDRFRAGPSLQKDPDELVKALTLVHHCLYWGSNPFVAHCLDTKATFNNLRQHSVAQVRSRAQAVVSLLDDSSRLKQERQSRATLIPQATTSSGIIQEKSTTKQVHEAPLKKTSRTRIPGLEPVLDLSKYVTKLGSRPAAGGGYSDVWKGVYKTESGTETVAIKFLRRLNKVPPDRLQKRLNRELRAWRNVRHQNITPFYGIIIDEHGDVGMISPYYSQGNVVDYVKRNQEIDPLKMLQGIADGVEYLHLQRIVHGDIKGANVMVSDDGTPKLIDFGLAQVIDDFAEVTGYTTSNLASSLRWSAPELLIGDSPVSSKTEKSDVYAFASTCIEIMTLRCPYNGQSDPQVLLHVIKGRIPDRPAMEDKWSPCDELWEFLETCWRIRPQERPTIVAAKRKLAEFYNGVVGTSAPPRRVRFVKGR